MLWSLEPQILHNVAGWCDMH